MKEKQLFSPDCIYTLLANHNVIGTSIVVPEPLAQWNRATEKNKAY